MFKNVYMLYCIYIFIQLYPLSAHNVCLTPRLLVHRHCHICLYLIFCCRDIYLLICLYLTCHVMYDLREIKCMFCSVHCVLVEAKIQRKCRLYLRCCLDPLYSTSRDLLSWFLLQDCRGTCVKNVSRTSFKNTFRIDSKP